MEPCTFSGPFPDQFSNAHSPEGSPAAMTPVSDKVLIKPLVDPVEMYEEAIAQMREWLSAIYPASKIDRALSIKNMKVSESIYPELHMRAKIGTFNNIYCISSTMHVDNPPGYLGCGSLSRRFRPGETWGRGNDLADGKFCEETWCKIIKDIVRYEAEEVKSEFWKDTQFGH